MNYHENDSCRLNPDAEPFQPHALIIARGQTTPVTCENSNTDDIDSDLLFGAFCLMLSAGLFLNFENINYDKYVVNDHERCMLDKLRQKGINNLNDHDDCVLNPNAEPFVPHTLTSAHSIANPILYENKDTIDTYNIDFY